MFNFLLAAGAFFTLFILFFISVLIGRKFGQWQMKHNRLHKVEVVTVAEGAVFALLGLLVAFTFTGAYDRFEARKGYIIEEANAIETAYLRIDLVGKNNQTSLRQSFKKYVDSRIELYQSLPYFRSAANQSSKQKMQQAQLQIWHEVVSATQTMNNPAVTQLMVNATNSMFEIANLRFDITQVHPPLIIFILLIGLATLSALLAGYSTAGNKLSNSIHILSYVAITAFTIYVIIDLEFPRHGLIRIDSFDQVLTEIGNQMSI